MRTSRAFGLRRDLLAVVGACVCLGAVPCVAMANFVYVCLCCTESGQRVYKAGWISGSCADLTAPIFEDCDDLFVGFVIHPTGGVGNGYAPAFDRAVMLGMPVVSSDGLTVTRIVMGTYPAPDTYTPGSYSTRIFAIQEAGIPGAPNRYAPIDINMTGLSLAADSIAVSSVPGGQPVRGLFDMMPGPIIATGDVTIVVETYRAALACCPDDKCCFAIDFAALDWQEALPLPPACFGDCDRSGAVNFADVTSVLANFNHSYPVGVLTPGDAQGDRVVNFADVTTVLANFGITCM